MTGTVAGGDLSAQHTEHSAPGTRKEPPLPWCAHPPPTCAGGPLSERMLTVAIADTDGLR